MYTERTSFLKTDYDEKIFDWADVTTRLGDDDIVIRIVQCFLVDTPGRLEQLSRAVHDKDSKNIETHSHSLKGAAATIGASALAEAAFALESMVTRNDFTEAEAALGQIKEKFEELTALLSRPDWVEVVKRQEEQENSYDNEEPRQESD
ncbi:MAG: Hpt domain-containing protein [Planctomycetota bacterium]